MEMYFGMSQSELNENGYRGIGIGGKLKSENIQWISPNAGANDSAGFSAFGSGLRMPDGTFTALLYSALFSWTSSSSEFDSSKAIYRELDYDHICKFIELRETIYLPLDVLFKN